MKLETLNTQIDITEHYALGTLFLPQSPPPCFQREGRNWVRAPASVSEFRVPSSEFRLEVGKRRLEAGGWILVPGIKGLSRLFLHPLVITRDSFFRQFFRGSQNDGPESGFGSEQFKIDAEIGKFGKRSMSTSSFVF